MGGDSTSKRSGFTQVTSVSVSKEFSKIIEQHNLSPTECFRRGVAVTLCDLGVAMYQSPKNEERAKYMQEWLKKLDDSEDLKKEYEQVESFMKIKQHLYSITKISEDIKNE